MDDLALNEHEARVLGVLIEKELTTPDQYPLSLNALGNGCNQKSNRDPVVDFLEAEIVVALQGLTMKGLAGRVTGSGSRVEKFRHNARERLKLDVPQTAILAELLMRGPQAPGELRSRVNRMSKLAGQDELRAPLEALQQAGLVVRLPPGHGSRAERFAQRLAPSLHGGAGSGAQRDASASTPVVSEVHRENYRETASTGSAAPAAPMQSKAELADRVQALEAEVTELRGLVQRLARDLGAEVE